MSRLKSGVADSADDNQSFTHGLLDCLSQRVVQVRFFVVAAGRDVDDANPILLTMRHHPLEAALDVLFGDAA